MSLRYLNVGRAPKLDTEDLAGFCTTVFSSPVNFCPVGSTLDWFKSQMFTFTGDPRYRAARLNASF